MFRLAAIVAAWAAWMLAGAWATPADVAEGRRPRDAGFSFVPVAPVFPLIAWGMALVIDGFAAPWGSVSLTLLHVVMGSG